MSGYYSHLGSMADVTTNFNWAQSQYTSLDFRQRRYDRHR
jgi:hypothetical protein